MNRPCPLAIALLTLTVLSSGCSALPFVSDGASDGGDSSVDIVYVLGHSHRRLVAWARGDSFGGKTLLDHQVVRESGIDRARYSEFLAKAEQFVNTPRRKPAELAAAPSGTATDGPAPGQGDGEACRTPFTVTVRTGAGTRVSEGCRGADDGTLSRLVRDGEFLLYSTQ